MRQFWRPQQGGGNESQGKLPVADRMESLIKQMKQVLQSTQELLGVRLPGLRASFKIVQMVALRESEETPARAVLLPRMLLLSWGSLPRFLPKVCCSRVTATPAPGQGPIYVDPNPDPADSACPCVPVGKCLVMGTLGWPQLPPCLPWGPVGRPPSFWCSDSQGTAFPERCEE